MSSYVAVARYPGRALDGTAIRAGDKILIDARTRKVLTADQEKIGQRVRDLEAAAFDEAVHAYSCPPGMD